MVKNALKKIKQGDLIEVIGRKGLLWRPECWERNKWRAQQMQRPGGRSGFIRVEYP